MEPVSLATVTLSSVTLDSSSYAGTFDFTSGAMYDADSLKDLGFFPAYTIVDGWVCY